MFFFVFFFVVFITEWVIDLLSLDRSNRSGLSIVKRVVFLFSFTLFYLKEMYILVVYFSGKWVFLVFGFVFRNTLSFLHPFIYLFQCLFLYCSKWTHEAYIKKINKVKTDLIGEWMTYQNSSAYTITNPRYNKTTTNSHTHTHTHIQNE